MDPTVREDFFMASRDRVRKNEVYDEVVERLVDVLRDHPGLKQLNAARRKKDIEDTLSNEEETTKLFNELLKADPMLARLFGGGDRLITKTGPGPEQPFNGKKFPTYFRLVKGAAGGLVKHCPVNLTCQVEFETDAANDYFKRADCPGSINVNPPNLIEHSRLWNGRFTVKLRVPWNAQPGDQFQVAVTVEDVQTQTRSTPLVSHFTLIADPETERTSRPGPGPVDGSTDPHGQGVSAPTLAPPEVKEKAFGRPQPSLEVRHDSNGGLEYFLNTDNAYLVTELTRAKEEDKPLVKFWFKYGLLLCALGMLKEQQERAEVKACAKNGDEANDDGEPTSADDLKQVNLYCDGIARVIISIVRTLYRGPQYFSN
jgi:hypothetical protein